MPSRSITVGWFAPRSCWRFVCGETTTRTGRRGRRQFYLQGSRGQALETATAIASEWDRLRAEGHETWPTEAEAAGARLPSLTPAAQPVAVSVVRPVRSETVGQSVEAFLAFKDQQAIAPESKARLRTRLNGAVASIKGEPCPPSVEVLNKAASVIAAREGISEAEGKYRLGALKSWLYWLRDAKGLIDDRTIRIGTDVRVVRDREVKEVEVLTPEQFGTMFRAADERMQAYSLTALACAFYARDLSDLRADELRREGDDWFIVRRRGKTGVKMNHWLWPEAVEAIERTRDGRSGDERVFLTAKGNPVVSRYQDTVGDRWGRLKKKALPEAPGFSALRDTCADWLYQRHGDDIRKLVLAHTRNRDVSDRYTRARFSALHEAQRAMREAWLPALGG